MLYRPLDEDEVLRRNLGSIRNMSSSNNQNSVNCQNDRFDNDAPPKYTPPPSYSTATGAKIAKILRQSIRRSFRRILRGTETLRPVISLPNEARSDQLACPTTNNLTETTIDICQSMEFDSRPPVNLIYGRSFSLGRKQILSRNRSKETISHALSGQSCGHNSSCHRKSTRKLHNRPFTADDVRTILRSSTLGRRTVGRSVHLDYDSNFRSIDNLVQSAELPNLSSSIIDRHPNLNNEYLASEI